MALAKEVFEQTTVVRAPEADPDARGRFIGPLASQAQFDKVTSFIERGVSEGARLVTGGPGRPAGFEEGYFVRPTVFADVNNGMTIAREEIFGPVLSIIPYKTEEEAVRIANDSIYGLSGHVFGADEARALAVARRIRTGTMSVNGGVWYSADVPFGGYRQSGIGREMGVAGFEEYLETKALARLAPGSAQ